MVDGPTGASRLRLVTGVRFAPPVSWGQRELSPHGGNSELGGDTANDEGPIPEGINHVAAHGWQVAYERGVTLVLFPSSSLVT